MMKRKYEGELMRVGEGEKRRVWRRVGKHKNLSTPFNRVVVAPLM
jgi:hypothetical protein